MMNFGERNKQVVNITFWIDAFTDLVFCERGAGPNAVHLVHSIPGQEVVLQDAAVHISAIESVK